MAFPSAVTFISDNVGGKEKQNIKSSSLTQPFRTEPDLFVFRSQKTGSMKAAFNTMQSMMKQKYVEKNPKTLMDPSRQKMYRKNMIKEGNTG